jgi:hypothetical protein
MNPDDVMQLLMEMLDDGTVFLKGPIAEKPDLIVASANCLVPGGKRVHCAFCSTALFMYDGFAVLNKFPDVPILCLPCAAAIAREKKIH